jgi:hypothetical protein
MLTLTHLSLSTSLSAVASSFMGGNHKTALPPPDVSSSLSFNFPCVLHVHLRLKNPQKVPRGDAYQIAKSPIDNAAPSSYTISMGNRSNHFYITYTRSVETVGYLSFCLFD